MKNALIIVDLQNDFLPGGALAVPHADDIISPINKIMNDFDWVIATKDLHPEDHVSFAKTWVKEVGETVQIDCKEQKLWPVHCVKDTKGSRHPSSLNQEQIHHTFYKGTSSQVDSYSIFFDHNRNPASQINTFLTVHQIKTLYFAGLATEYCVKYSVLDALLLGYEVFVIQDCCKGIQSKDEKKALELMKQKGAKLVLSHKMKIKSLISSS